MKKLTTKIMSFILTLSMIFSLNITAYASGRNANIDNIKKLVEVAQAEIKNNGEASDNTVKKLEYELSKIGITTGSYSGTHSLDENSISILGYGETHDLGQGWTYRVDRPAGGEAKPHVHVDNNRSNVHGAENVDGTPSHGKTLSGSKVPKDVQKKVKGSADYKKGQQDLNKMKKAKQEISRQNLDLSQWKDVVIAAGIFVAIVGVAFFAPEALPAVLVAI
jgi:hypothetical protein